MPTPQQLIEAHEQAGTYFEAAGVQSFVRQEGDGEPVVCMHGVPSSSYLYRKLLPVLGKEGYRGIAFDLPGLGLAQRPQDFDYSWTGLGKWSSNAVDSLGLDRYHLVIHDIGGPVGMEMVARHPERILSLTILNTLIINLPQCKNLRLHTGEIQLANPFPAKRTHGPRLFELGKIDDQGIENR
ncbi:MAG: alpha/beta fold hydrolase, partial [Bacteroidota bacterium]